MMFKKNKTGQAAIEFLMTYGWMLLVVLIVGALIFSFVDFGSLLPNKLDLSNNLRGDPTGSIAYDSKASVLPNQVMVVFRYNGAKRAIISPKDAIIKSELGDTCYAVKLTNLNTGANVNVSDIDIGTKTYSFDTTAIDTPFLNGHDGLMVFDCNSDDSAISGVYTVPAGEYHGVQGGLLSGDTVVGTISIPVSDPKTSLEIPSTGSIRLSVTG